MSNGIDYFIGRDGRLHGEARIGALRFDPTQPSFPMTTVIGSSAGITTTMKPDGQIGIERRDGNIRYEVGKPGFDIFI